MPIIVRDLFSRAYVLNYECASERRPSTRPLSCDEMRFFTRPSLAFAHTHTRALFNDIHRSVGVAPLRLLLPFCVIALRRTTGG